MRIFIVLPALVAVGLCAPRILGPGEQAVLLSPTPPEPILRDARQGPDPSGNYAFEYETALNWVSPKYEQFDIDMTCSKRICVFPARGIYQQEQGRLANPSDPDHSGTAVEGSYQYPGENGVIIRIEYRAGPNGFEAFGDHLPKSPAIPPAIQVVLDQILSQPPTPDPYDPAVIAAQRGTQYIGKKK